MTEKFKVGDRVRYINDKYPNFFGLTGTVLRSCDTGNVVVKLDQGQDISRRGEFISEEWARITTTGSVFDQDNLELIKFEVGDRVRLNQQYGGLPAGTELVVDEIENLMNGVLLIYAHVSGGFKSISCYPSRLDLVKETTPEKTDKELADEYRRLRKQASTVAEILIGKGYKTQYRVGNTTIWNPVSLKDNRQYRFVKQEEIVL